MPMTISQKSIFQILYPGDVQLRAEDQLRNSDEVCDLIINDEADE